MAHGLDFLLTFFMNRWIPYAFVRIVLFFMSGICVAIFYPAILSETSARLIFLACVLFYVMLTFCLWQKRTLPLGLNLKVVAGIIGLAAIFVAGFIRVGSHTASRSKDHLLHVKSPIEYFTAVLTSAGTEKSSSWKAEASIGEINSNGQWKATEGRVLLYFSKKDFSRPLEYGDRVLVKGNPYFISPPSNPEEFDYRQFLIYKNIYHQKFIGKNDVTKIGFAPASWIDYYALQTRKWADGTLARNIKGDREQALASALILGVTDGLDDELLSAYKATGTLHVLAVSGLHVGILYGLVLFILKPISRFKYGPWAVACISIVALWGYAFVTGLSPSVLRAVTMFSFVALAKPAGRRTNIYNTLAASAFCILLVDPFLIMSVGFQLSYLAVLGIVYIQQGLYNLWEPANSVLDEIWKLSCVSIAAQLATFPIGLLYFHQFPNYFLLSNLLVIPASFIVLVLGMATLATSMVPLLATSIGVLLAWVIKVMNYTIFILEDLPFSLIENVYITPLQCWLLIGILISMLLLIQTRKFKWIKIAFAFSILFSLAQWHHFEENINIRRITIYNVAGHTAIDLIDNGHVYFVTDSILNHDRDKIGFHIASNRIKCGVRSVIPAELLQKKLPGCSLMVWKGQSILQIDRPQFFIPKGLCVDYVIVSNNAVANLAQLQSQVNAKKYILDSSNSRTLGTKWLEENEVNRVEIFSILHDGALELNI